MCRALLYSLVFLLSTSSLFAQDCSEITEVFQVVENMPRFPGCEHISKKSDRISCASNKLTAFINKNLKMPQEVNSGAIEGKGIVTFVVDPKGRICSPRVYRSVCESCDEEMLRLVNSMPNFVPGSQRGRKVAVQLSLPINFSKQKRKK